MCKISTELPIYIKSSLNAGGMLLKVITVKQHRIERFSMIINYDKDKVLTGVWSMFIKPFDHKNMSNIKAKQCHKGCFMGKASTHNY